MIIVMPMAGRGDRFKRAGFATPKPLIKVDGVEMFVRATRSLPLASADQIIFAILEEHVAAYGMDAIIRREFAGLNVKIVTLAGVTAGQAETVARAVEGAAANQALLIFNADSAFRDPDLGRYLKELPGEVAGMLQVFSDSSDRWSFVRCERNWEVVETAEKRPISDLASTGLYYFRSVAEYLNLVRKYPVGTGESYIAPFYNHLISAGRVVLARPVDWYACFGTPTDFDDYVKRGKYFHYHAPAQ